MRPPPPAGAGGHRAAGPRVGETRGRPAPTLPLDNEGGRAVTARGRAGEPLARLSRESVEATLASPPWTDVGRSLGFLPAALPEGAGAARWERILEGRRGGWPDSRSAPPELPPPFLTRVVANCKAG